MINTYGLKMDGLEDASKETIDWPISGYVSIIRYDKDDGKVWVTEATDNQLAGKYDVFRTSRHVSAQKIADEIANYVKLSKMSAQGRYDAVHTVQISVKLNRKTDADILDLLEKQPNRQGYIKGLLRKELAAE